MPKASCTGNQQRHVPLPLKLRTPKAYIAWAFLALIPIAFTQAAVTDELRVLGLAIIGSAGVDVLLAMGIALVLEPLRRQPSSRWARPPWRAMLARRRPAKPFWPSGALLCGVIIGLLLDPTSDPTVAFAAGALSSVSKHTIRYRSRHVFNPAAIGLLAGSLLFSERISWWGALPAIPLPATILMLLAGAIVLDRSRKLPAGMAFLTTYYAVFLLVALIDPQKATEAFRSPISNAVVFCASFMVSDPPTAPVSIPTQLAFGALTALLAATLELTFHSQTFLITALIAGNVYAAHARTLRGRRRSRQNSRQPRGPNSASPAFGHDIPVTEADRP